jgi:hypothetical protein
MEKIVVKVKFVKNVPNIEVALKISYCLKNKNYRSS